MACSVFDSPIVLSCVSKVLSDEHSTTLHRKAVVTQEHLNFEQCFQHNNYLKRLYCFHCSVELCTLCFLQDHHLHQVDYVEMAENSGVETKRNHLKNLLAQLSVLNSHVADPTVKLTVRRKHYIDQQRRYISRKLSELCSFDAPYNQYFVFTPRLIFSSVGTEVGQLHRPWGICCDVMGNIIVADTFNNRVQVFSKAGKLQFSFGSLGTRPGEFSKPTGLALSSKGHIVVADKENHRIQVFAFNGRLLRTFGKKGRYDGQLYHPFDVAINAADEILVSDSGNKRIQLFDLCGRFLKKFQFGNLEAVSLAGISFGRTGNIVVCDAKRNCVYVVDKYFSKVERKIQRWSIFNPQGVAVDVNGHIVVSSYGNSKLQVFSEGGKLVRMIQTSGKFVKPTGICFTSDDHVLAACVTGVYIV